MTSVSNTVPPVSLPEATALSTPSLLPLAFDTTDPPPTLITQGAEALLYRTHFLNPSTPAALKVRPSKSYRHPTLDARLTRQRVLAEARVLVKLAGLGSNGIHVPGVLGVEWDIGRRVKGLGEERRGLSGQRPNGSAGGTKGGAWLLMEWVEGRSVKELLQDWDLWQKSRKDTLTDEELTAAEADVKKLLQRIGKSVGAMHAKGGVVHGDLTTSNIMVRPEEQGLANGYSEIQNGDATTDAPTTPPSLTGDIVLIDFGLATQSIQDEDRAVDLYVLERAFGSTHPRQEEWFDVEVLQSAEGYLGSFKGSQIVLRRLEEVRLRGRKRSMLG